MARLVFNRDGGSANEYGHLLALSRFMTGEVIEGMAVTAPGSNMTVSVGIGTAAIPTGTTPSNYSYFVGVDTAGGESVTITTANSSNPRIDVIVAYVDKSVTPSTGTPNNPNNMLKLVAVAGTPAASPSAPNTAAIQAAIGAANPFIILANVTVGTSVTQITNTNIADKRKLSRGGVPANNLYAFRFTKSSQSINSNTFNTISMDTVDFDLGSAGITSGGYKAPIAGVYHFSASCSQASASVDLLAALFVNGSERSRGFWNGATNPSGTLVDDDLKLNAGDIVVFAVWQSTGSAKTVNAAHISGHLVTLTT